MNVELWITALERYQKMLATEAAQVEAMLATVRPRQAKQGERTLASEAAAAASFPLYSQQREPDEDVEPAGSKPTSGKKGQTQQQLLGQLKGGVTI